MEYTTALPHYGVVDTIIEHIFMLGIIEKLTWQQVLFISYYAEGGWVFRNLFLVAPQFYDKL